MRATNVAIAVLSLGACADAFAPAALPSASRLSLRSSSLSVSMTAEVQRREALGRFATAAAALVFAPALPARAAKGPARNAKATEEDTVAAVATLRAAKEQLKSIGDKLKAGDYEGVNADLATPEFENIEANLLTLVNGPVLNIDDKRAIGTRKRYGVAADVIYGVGGVKGAIEAIGTPQLQGCSNGQCSGKMVDGAEEAQKSLDSLSNALNEILNICKNYKNLA